MVFSGRKYYNNFLNVTLSETFHNNSNPPFWWLLSINKQRFTMKMLKSMIPIILVLITTSLFAQQEAGRLFNPKEAAALFGNVTAEKEISVFELKYFLSNTSDKLMFTITDNQLFVLGDHRAAIYPVNKFLGKAVVAYSFSKSKVLEFLAANPNAAKIKVQMRGSALCLDNDVKVLEFALPCPPYCD